ncbi:hypothetical protein Scep_009955 [Stephania cephalantha]|uniref:Pentatricopeptide repeat-containing protein n=1 Tax=Stephania cephalantha TaxID=152367 RepID=A0AAP0PES7_9MAGN
MVNRIVRDKGLNARIEWRGVVGHVVGQQGHGHMIKSGLPFTVSVSNTVMDMYAKCGMMREARRVFGEMGRRSVVS